jgi:hypothetical protein
MFRLKHTPTYWWTVKVPVAAGGEVAGKVEVMDFDVEFVRMDEDELKALNVELIEQNLLDKDLCTRIVKNWRGVIGDDGQSLPFSAETFTAVLKLANVAPCLARAFYESRQPAALKN